MATRKKRKRTARRSAARLKRLTGRDQQVMTLDDFSQADLAAIRQAEPPAEAAAFDDEVSG